MLPKSCSDPDRHRPCPRLASPPGEHRLAPPATARRSTRLQRGALRGLAASLVATTAILLPCQSAPAQSFAVEVTGDIINPGWLPPNGAVPSGNIPAGESETYHYAFPVNSNHFVEFDIVATNTGGTIFDLTLTNLTYQTNVPTPGSGSLPNGEQVHIRIVADFDSIPGSYTPSHDVTGIMSLPGAFGPPTYNGSIEKCSSHGDPSGLVTVPCIGTGAVPPPGGPFLGLAATAAQQANVTTTYRIDTEYFLAITDVNNGSAYAYISLPGSGHDSAVVGSMTWLERTYQAELSWSGGDPFQGNTSGTATGVSDVGGVNASWNPPSVTFPTSAPFFGDSLFMSPGAGVSGGVASTYVSGPGVAGPPGTLLGGGDCQMGFQYSTDSTSTRTFGASGSACFVFATSTWADFYTNSVYEEVAPFSFITLERGTYLAGVFKPTGAPIPIPPKPSSVVPGLAAGAFRLSWGYSNTWQANASFQAGNEISWGMYAAKPQPEDTTITFGGLPNQAFGDAELTLVDGTLVWSSSNPTTPDGLSIALGETDGWSIEFASTPDLSILGNILRLSSRGTVNGVDDQPIGNVRVEGMGAGEVAVSVDDSALGAESATVEFFGANGELLGTITVENNCPLHFATPPAAQLDAPGPQLKNYNEAKSNTTKNAVYGWTSDNPVTWIPSCGAELAAIDGVVSVEVTPQRLNTLLNSFKQALAIKEKGVQVYSIAEEGIQLFGAMNVALGEATMLAANGTLTIGNIGSSELDGVQMAVEGGMVEYGFTLEGLLPGPGAPAKITVGRDADIRTGAVKGTSSTVRKDWAPKFKEGGVDKPFGVEALLGDTYMWVNPPTLYGDFGSTNTWPIGFTLGSGDDDCITLHFPPGTQFELLDRSQSFEIDTLRVCPGWAPSDDLIDRVFITASDFDTFTITDAVVTLPTAPTPCPGDIDGGGVVDGADLGVLLGSWGSGGPADLDGSGTVDGADLGLLLGSWGSCP